MNWITNLKQIQLKISQKIILKWIKLLEKEKNKQGTRIMAKENRLDEYAEQ